MKVRVSDINHNGLKIREELPLGPLQSRLAGGRGQDIIILSAPKVDLIITQTINGAQTVGFAEFEIEQPCSRCTEAKARLLKVDLALNFHRRPELDEIDELAPDAEFSEDIGVCYFEGDHINLEDVIQEAIILHLSLFWAPDCDNEDNCTLCGRNREKFEIIEESKPNTLANLFKKVGLN